MKIIHEYYDSDTLKIRDGYIAKFKAELFKQLEQQLQALNIEVVDQDGKPVRPNFDENTTWIKTTGQVENKFFGREVFFFTTKFKVVKNGTAANLQMDSVIIGTVRTKSTKVVIEPQYDDLGNLKTPGRTFYKLERTMLMTTADNELTPIPGAVAVNNADTGKLVFKISNNLPGEDDPVQRMLKLMADEKLPTIEADAPVEEPYNY